MNITLQQQPRRSALLSGHSNTLDVLIRIQAPEQTDTQTQPSPLNLSIVIDRSGSMGGQPLREAVRCARFMIDSLKDTDRISVVTYDNTVDVLAPSQPVGDRQRLHALLRTISTGGSTALHAGWLAGAEQASNHLSPSAISRVLVLSDGQANHGLKDPVAIAQQCGALADSGVSTSTYGLGQNFNEDLMGEMAKAGLGNSYYGRSAEDLMDPFREEFDLLNALVARNVTLNLKVADGVKFTVCNGYTQGESGWKLPDLAYAGEGWALVRLHIPAARIDTLDGQELLQATINVTDLEGQQHTISSTALSLPAVPASAFGAISEDDLVRRRALELEAANYQEKARDAALRGDWRAVERLLTEAEEASKDNEWLQQNLSALRKYAKRRQRDAFSKESYYSARKMRTRLTSQQEVAWSEDSNVPTFLRRKREQGRGNPE